jgi:hypothetical protein
MVLPAPSDFTLPTNSPSALMTFLPPSSGSLNDAAVSPGPATLRPSVGRPAVSLAPTLPPDGSVPHQIPTPPEHDVKNDTFQPQIPQDLKDPTSSDSPFCSSNQVSCLYGSHPFAFVLTSLVLLLFACWQWKFWCCKDTRDFSRGEYRAVTARYTDSAFADDYSVEENQEYLSDEDDGDGYGGWNSNGGGKHVIEMKDLGIEGKSDNLTLEEMNG